MSEKLVKCGIKREDGFMYFVDGNGNASRVMAARCHKAPASKAHEVIAAAGIKKEPGYLYFIDKQGDISRAKMARGRKKQQ